MNASSLLKKVRKIEIKSKGLSNHIFAGEYHTAFKGTGMAFSEVREYQSGDDIRSIDWNVTARYNTPFVKIFEEEREMTVMLLIDVSASGDFGTNKQYKKDLATEIAAVLAFSAIKNNDKVGVIFFSDRIEKFIIPKKGKSHILRIIREIVSLEPDSKGTDIAMALEYFNSVIKKRSICFLLSDFTSTPFSKPLKIASKKHDIVGVRVHDKRESEMPNIGLVPMQDMETDKLVYVDTSNKEIRLNYSKTRSQKIKELNKIFETNGVDLVQISTGEDYVKPLVNFFKRRGKRK
ncbi:MAG: DUF58 domain-containing protein [Flavobacteriales bacterium]|mgnify:FL=1|jgi:uncharacterized protein (DUF58 family)|nr:DUF58 domain-containing protein [Flavobacteriales bacterium]MDA7578802.1 DUF58 domain-containing protein [Flavobacteriales bacterium]MDC0909113.1 DUF58 domain-containing protein [Flavobacteriales bacterium]MDC1069391.1 DUF58 domain-containing protein [Flavobacteriales bacterium]MDC3390554.1 DUF58 domain-containing protein [Flavobacteriales bacterium]